MEWTNALPTVPGWYWWRDASSRKTCTLIERWERDNDGVMRTGDLDCRESSESIRHQWPDCQWAGPLPEPKGPPRTGGDRDPMTHHKPGPSPSEG